jgi:DNA-binding NarL/FixJ family response regulator
MGAPLPISAGTSGPDPARKPVRLTPAETRILPLLATYLTLDGIADRLEVRRSTVKTHVMSIYRKLGVSNRANAIERAEDGGYLPAGAAAHRRRLPVGDR